MFHSIASRIFATTVLAAALATTALAAGDIRFTAEQAYPESITWSAAQDTFFVGSIHRGVIGKVGLDGHYTPFTRDGELVSSVGLQFDATRNLVWAAVGDLGNSV